MQVLELRLEDRDAGRELSGRVRFERGDWNPSGCGFGRRPVSPLLLANADRASLVMRSWWPSEGPRRLHAKGTPGPERAVQIAVAGDLARRAAKRLALVGRRRLRRQIDRVWSRAR